MGDKKKQQITLADTYPEHYGGSNKKRSLMSKIGSGITLTFGAVCLTFGILVGKNLK